MTTRSLLKFFAVAGFALGAVFTATDQALALREPCELRAPDACGKDPSSLNAKLIKSTDYQNNGCPADYPVYAGCDMTTVAIDKVCCAQANQEWANKLLDESICPAGQSRTKPSPGIGPMQCGENQCREQGWMYFTACMPNSACQARGGTTNGGNKAGCAGGEGDQELFCCQMSKNRCKSDRRQNDKIYLCTGEEQCQQAGGTPDKGFGCQSTGLNQYCCELPDSDSKAMPIIGENLIPQELMDQSQVTGNRPSMKRSVRPSSQFNAFCFTKSECQSADGTWKESAGDCYPKGVDARGYCMAPEPDYELQYPVFGEKTIKGLRSYIGLLFNGMIGILLITSALFFVWGGFRYLTSTISKDVQNAKDRLWDSVVGLILGLSAYAILAAINPNTVNFKPQEIKMINRVNYFDLTYCSDLPASEHKFAEAGAPDSPKPLKNDDPFAINLDGTKCGFDYYIESTKGLSVCMGTGCGAGGGTCLNCGGKLEGCNTNSAVEHQCIDGYFLGKVTSKTEADEVSMDFVCIHKADSDAYTKELTNFNLANLSKSSTGVSSGFVGSYNFPEININELEKYFADCNTWAGGGNIAGIVLVAQVKGKSLLENQSIIDRRFIVSKKHCAPVDFCDNESTGALVYVLGSNALASLTNPIMTIHSLLSDGAGTDTTLEGMIETVHKEFGGSGMEMYIGTYGWQLDEIRNAINNKTPIVCNLDCNYDASDFTKDGWAKYILNGLQFVGR